MSDKPKETVCDQNYLSKLLTDLAGGKIRKKHVLPELLILAAELSQPKVRFAAIGVLSSVYSNYPDLATSIFPRLLAIETDNLVKSLLAGSIEEPKPETKGSPPEVRVLSGDLMRIQCPSCGTKWLSAKTPERCPKCEAYVAILVMDEDYERLSALYDGCSSKTS